METIVIHLEVVLWEHSHLLSPLLAHLHLRAMTALSVSKMQPTRFAQPQRSDRNVKIFPVPTGILETVTEKPVLVVVNLIVTCGMNAIHSLRYFVPGRKRSRRKSGSDSNRMQNASVPFSDSSNNRRRGHSSSSPLPAGGRRPPPSATLRHSQTPGPDSSQARGSTPCLSSLA